MCYLSCTYQKHNITIPNMDGSPFFSSLYMENEVLKKIANFFFRKEMRSRGDLVIKRFMEKPRSDFYIRGAEIGRIDNALIRAFPEVVHLHGANFIIDCVRQRERFINSMTIKSIGGIMMNIVQSFHAKLPEATIFAYDSENPQEGVIFIPEEKIGEWKNHSVIQVSEVIEEMK